MRRRDLSNETLVRYVQGEMTRSEREAIERVVADSRREQERVAEVRAMIDQLLQPPDWVQSVDLVDDVRARLARGDGAALPAGRRQRFVWWSLAAAGAAAAILAVALIGRQPGESVAGDRAVASVERVERDRFDGDAIRPKGAASSDPDRWVGIQVAQVRLGSAPVSIAAGDRIGRRELQVAYTNLGPRPYSHLMVFAVDAAGQVRWFYPAYERAGTDPSAIAIQPGAAGALLPDLVEHEFAAGRLVLCGLFLRAPLTVGQVESALAGRQPAPGARLPFSDAGQHCLDLVAE